MTNVEKIMILANKMANEGKQPTVALIKARFPEKIPLPHIISALKSWKHEPENCEFDEVKPEKEIKTENNNTSQESDVLTITKLNETLAPIKQELADIKLLLKQLTDKL